jgi:hypothetical protein
MSRLLDECFAANQRWAAAAVAKDPTYFKRLEAIQRPELLWIGCSDSRAAPERDRRPAASGELFVHRNVANVVDPHRPQLPVGDPVRGRCAAGEARDRRAATTAAAASAPRCAASRIGLSDNWLRHVPRRAPETRGEAAVLE